MYDVDALIKQLKEYQNKVTNNHDEALKALVRAGLVDESGKPTEPYRTHRDRNEDCMTLRVDDFWALHRCIYCKGQGEENIFALIGGWDENKHIADRSLFKAGSVIMVTDRHNVPLGNFEIIRDESPAYTSSGRLCFTFVARRKS